jgi:prepilin-type processing-associated H-X9-DG protein/prepilin-type N-terminal cleavage/methylation domain-containing protein
MNTAKRGAFTMIELLVVIAVIALLAALLAPTYRMAQEAGRTSKCSDNLRQIGAAMGAFAGEHEDCFPESGGTIPWGATDSPPPNGSDQASWMQQLAPYLGNPTDPATGVNGSVFTCPSSSLVAWGDKYYSYFNGAHAASAQQKLFGAVCRTLISNPAEHILSGDFTDWTNAAQMDADKDDYVHCPIDQPAPFHNGTINLLFADGHVENEKWNPSLSPPGYFDQTRMSSHYGGPGAGPDYTYGYPTY